MTHILKNTSLENQRNDILKIKRRYKISMLHTKASVKGHILDLIPLPLLYPQSHYKN